MNEKLESALIVLCGVLYIFTVNILAYNQFHNPDQWIGVDVAIAPIPIAIIVDSGILLLGVLTWLRKTV